MIDIENRGAILGSTAHSAIDNTHTQVFGLAAVICLVALLMLPGRRYGLDCERRAYWCGVVAAAVCLFIAALPNLSTAIVIAALCLYIYTGHAYFRTQYLKIGGRVLSFRTSKELFTSSIGNGEDPYGARVSAPKFWWLMAFCMLLGAANLLGYVIGGESLRYGLLGLGVLGGVAVLVGLGDGRHRQRVARGQYLQFGVVTVISAGIFTVCYLLARSVGLRMRRPTQ